MAEQTLIIKKISQLNNSVQGQLPQTALFVVEIDGVTYQVDASKVLSSGNETDPDNITWIATLNYNNGEIVFAFGDFWQSLVTNGVDHNIGNTPAEGSAFWEKIEKSASNGTGRYAPGLFTIDPTLVVKEDVSDGNKDKLYSLVAVRGQANPTYNSTDFDAELIAGDWQIIGDITRQRSALAVVPGVPNTLTLDWNNKNELVSNNIVPVSAAVTVVYSQTASAEFTDFLVNITNLAPITFPVVTVSPDTNWSSLVWTPPGNGIFEISIRKVGTTYLALFTQQPAV